MIEILQHGFLIRFNAWSLRVYIGSSEFCLFRLRLMSRDIYDNYVAVFEIACLWLSVEIGYNEQ